MSNEDRLAGKESGRGPERKLFCKRIDRSEMAEENAEGIEPVKWLSLRESVLRCESKEREDEIGPRSCSLGNRRSTTVGGVAVMSQETPRHEQGAPEELGFHPESAALGSSSAFLNVSRA